MGALPSCITAGNILECLVLGVIEKGPDSEGQSSGWAAPGRRPGLSTRPRRPTVAIGKGNVAPNQPELGIT
jgi:hypothetical protein